MGANVDQLMAMENSWKSSVGKVVGDACLAIIDADIHAKDAQLARIMSQVGLDPLDFTAETSLVGLEQKLQTALQVPHIVAAMSTSLGIDEATVKMSMDVSAVEEDNTNIKFGSETEASASGGFLWAKGSVRQKATLGVTNDRKRKTDYRSTMNVDVTMRQQDPPEALMMIIDAIVENVKKGIELNRGLIEKQADKVAEEMDGVDNIDIPKEEDK